LLAPDSENGEGLKILTPLPPDVRLLVNLYISENTKIFCKIQMVFVKK